MSEKEQTVKELKELAKQKGIPGYSSMTKATLKSELLRRDQESSRLEGGKLKAWWSYRVPAHRLRLVVLIVIVVAAILSIIWIFQASQSRAEMAINSNEFGAVGFTVVVSVLIPALLLSATDNVVFFASGRPKHVVHVVQAVLSVLALVVWCYMYGTGLYNILFHTDFMSQRETVVGLASAFPGNTLLAEVQSLLTYTDCIWYFAVGLGLFPYGVPEEDTQEAS